MDSSAILQLCRLCLVKDDVNIPIFEEQGDIRQIQLKITSCLPVKVAEEDHLPKRICDGCSSKLDNFYDFWRTSAESEKQLLAWLGAAEKEAAQVNVKQEKLEEPLSSDIPKDEDEKGYMFEQKIEENSASSAAAVPNEDEPPPKRARRTAAVKAAIAMDQNSDDDDDSGEPVTKVEDESDETDGEDREPAFVDVPSTSADDQPGPSGVSKDGSEAPTVMKMDAPNVFMCQQCRKVFETKKQLRCHGRAHRKKSIPCDICGKMFTLRNIMLKHKEGVHLAKYEHNCEFCDARFKTIHTLNNHKRIKHIKDYKFPCDNCDRGFFLRKDLEIHNQVKHQQICFKCRYCEKPYRSLQSLNQHEPLHDPNYKRKEYRCVDCSRVFRDRGSFARHKNAHKAGNKQQYMCDICGKSVTTQTSLKNHVRSHSGEKSYTCNYCGNRFASKPTLVTHIRIHTDEKPYRCLLCQKRFRQKPALNIHMRYHTGEKPYHCEICNKNFISKTVLNYHRCKGPAA